MKKLLLLLLAVVMVFSALFVPIAAQADPPIGDVSPYPCMGALGLWNANECDDVTTSPQEPLNVHGNRCWMNHRRAGTEYEQRKFCMAVETTIPFQEDIWGRLWSTNPGSGVDDVKVNIDYVQLMNAGPEPDHVIAFDDSPTNGQFEWDLGCCWTTPTFYLADPTCNWPNGITVYAKARYRIKWTGLPNQPVGSWKTIRSFNTVEHCE